MDADAIVRQWGARMRERRRAAGISQAGLGVLLGTDQQQVSKWENGDQEPRLATRLAIAQALECGHDDIFAAS